jgi:hypothetical protein
MPADLLQQCITVRAKGADFPTIWKTVLQPNPLVAGLPVQKANRERAWLEIPLTTGHRLVHDSENGFQLLDLVSSVLQP